MTANSAKSNRSVPPVVLFFTDNGKGLGHVTRLLATARQARSRFRPVFLTLSLGYETLRSEGVPAEFFPAYHQLGLTKAEWVPLLKARLAEVIRDVGARVVVVDHVTPPMSFEQLRSETKGVEWIWSRRALWRRGKNEDALDLVAGFDRVVEPGDLASPVDVGASTSQKDRVHSVDPIVLVQPSEYLSRQEARRRLGLPADGRAVLLNLSAPDSVSLTTMFRQVKDAIESVGGQERIHLFAPVHPLSANRLETLEGLNFAPVYPVARYFKAFDGAISMAGYNSYHEIVASGLPVIFIPHSSTNVDDQERRARFGELVGRAHWAPTTDDDRFREAVERLLHPAEVGVAQRVTNVIGPLSGAAQFADLIAEAVERMDSVPLSVPKPTVGEDTRALLSLKIHSGSRNRRGRSPTTVLLACLDHSTEELAELATQLRDLQRNRPWITPIVLIGATSPGPLVEHGFVFESVMSADVWAATGGPLTYAEYFQRRVEGARERYGATLVMELAPGDELGALTEEKMADPGPISAPDTAHRSFRLRLPTMPGYTSRSLDIEVPSSLSIPKQLQGDGLSGYEPESLACWMAILSRPDPGAAFDVGANVGPYAWLAAALTPRDVRAFEPVPQLARALAAVSHRNELGITVEEVALADRDGVATLFLSDRSDSSNSLLRGFRRSSESIEVEMTTLDSYLMETGAIPYALKIDTETTEPEVLAGARKTLVTHRPWLIVEVLAQRSEERLREVIEPLGYSWYRIDDRFPLQRTDTIVGDPRHRQMNWLFAPAEPEAEFWENVAVWHEAFRGCVPDQTRGPSRGTGLRQTESTPSG